MTIDDRTEWLETDGLGGFASGTTSGIRTRRYHALLLAATTPPTGRLVLVNGCDAWARTPAGSFPLTTQRYAPGVLHPGGSAHIVDFTNEPWPTWTFELPDGTRVGQQLFVEYGTGTVYVSWILLRGGNVELTVRPFLSGRDYHAMHHQNDAFRFAPERRGSAVVLWPYDGVPGVSMDSNGAYREAPEWYRQFLYRDEQERGLDATEDLASPGEFVWRVSEEQPEAVLVLSAIDRRETPRLAKPALDAAAEARAQERRRRALFATPLDRAADAYLVRRGTGKTLVAGYPWFTDWGRDTFIALRGLCLAAKRLAEARDILVEWAGAVSEGMLPNRFPDHGEVPEFNSVDASLWYVVAVHELFVLDREGDASCLTMEQRTALVAAVLSIVDGYARGTRFGIRMDQDGLLAAGVPGVQLTWMDARVGDRVITPRIGKPVEVQALWANALWIAAGFDPRWNDVLQRASASFVQRFWNEERGLLADVVDVDHVAGTRDDTFRPNQILAIGGLPLMLLAGARARRVVDQIERMLLTPLGLRSLAPDEPGYAPVYAGPPAARDAVYHQGTVWPWLMGPFVEAWVRTHGDTGAARNEARTRFLEPLFAHTHAAGLGHVSEIADAEAPFHPKGCPFQAWSLGELLRLDRLVLARGRRRFTVHSTDDGHGTRPARRRSIHPAGGLVRELAGDP